MASSEIPNKKNWENAHQNLKLSLQKEIGIMRELLANLHEEELSLLERNISNWQKVMDQRSQLVMQLSIQRNRRLKALSKIEAIAKKYQITDPFPAQDELSCETLSLIDQLVALVERLNMQNCRNDALFDQTKQQKDLPLYCSYPLQQSQKAKRKNSIATYPRDKST